MKNMQTKFTILFLIILLCVPTVLIHADDTIADTTPPVITLLGDATTSIPDGTQYVDAGATANDDIDGDITPKITITGSVDTTTAGTYTLTYTISDAAGNAATPIVRTVIVEAPVVASTEKVFIRDGDVVVYQGTVDLPAAGTITVIDDTGSTHAVNADSVLGLVSSIDQTSDAFSISDVAYYSSFGSLYLKCLTPTGSMQACDNWQYVINDTTPATGMDSTLLSGGETINLYFGSPHQVLIDTTPIVSGGAFTATAQKYNYIDNTWSSLSGVTIGVTTPNPNDPYNPTVIVTKPVDENGLAVFTLTDVGTYTIGISEDYYFPAYAVVVTAPIISGGGGGGGGVPPPQTAFNIPSALAYLVNAQSSDGSFGGSDMYTDWAAIAFGATDPSGATTTNILGYMSSHGAISSVITDNERHAMALLSLGQNPYSFHDVDYITPILNSFDGTQFGDSSLVNDDIFALIPLSSSGYSATDPIISKDIGFIISKQNADGSWNASVDMTAAAIQALEPYNSIDAVAAALAKATSYMRVSQTSDGGFGTVYSTSWATQAMSALKDTSWTNNNHTVDDYFAAQQSSDGAAAPSSVSSQNRIWATSYVIPAVLGKSWASIMHAVGKPATIPQNTVSGGGGSTALEMSVSSVPAPKDALVVSAPAIEPGTQTPPVVVYQPARIKESAPEPRIIKVQNTIDQKNTVVLATKTLSASAAQSGAKIPVPLAVGFMALGIVFVGGVHKMRVKK